MMEEYQELNQEEELNIGDIDIEITSGEIVTSFYPSPSLVPIENVEQLSFRKRNNPRNCYTCNEPLIRQDRLPASNICPGLSSTLFAGSPYQKVYFGPRCFFPMGIFFGYSCCCSGCCGYCGCVATPISILTCPFDCALWCLGCCNLHPCSQRRIKCNNSHCDRMNTNTFARDITDTCCDCADGYPLDFDEYYYICPNCRDKANKPCCCFFMTEYDKSISDGYDATTNFCKDCAFYPELDDRVLTSNTFAILDGDIAPVYALKRSDGLYDARRNFFGESKGITHVLKGSKIFKRIYDEKIKCKALDETCELDTLRNTNWLLIVFGEHPTDLNGSPSIGDKKDIIKHYAQVIDRAIYHEARWNLRIIRKIELGSRNDNGVIEKVEVTYFSDTVKKVTVDSKQLHLFKCIEDQPTGVKFPIITRTARLEGDESLQPMIFNGGQYEGAQNLESALQIVPYDALCAYYFSSDPLKPAKIYWYMKHGVARTLSINKFYSSYDMSVIEFVAGLQNGKSNSSSIFPVITPGAYLDGDSESNPQRFDGGGQYEAKNIQDAIQYVQSNAPNAVVGVYYSADPNKASIIKYYCKFAKPIILCLTTTPAPNTDFIDGTVIEFEPGLQRQGLNNE